MNSATIPVAQATGFYRCTGMGETWFREAGEELTPCNCPGAIWELRAEDNFREGDAIFMLIGKGILHATAIDELPNVGSEYNFRGGKCPEYNGKYRVSSVETIMWAQRDEIHVLVEKIGEIDPKLPIYRLLMLNC